jgi:REP element-mobilizing transposase RayT
MSKVKLLFHIVFTTKKREMTINESHCEDLYRFITKFIKENKCNLKRVNGIENHIHILVDMNQELSISDFVKHLKHDSSMWMHMSGLFPLWQGWCSGYFACSVSPKMQQCVIDYIKNQKEHHKGVITMEREYLALLRSAGLEHDGYIME